MRTYFGMSILIVCVFVAGVQLATPAQALTPPGTTIVSPDTATCIDRDATSRTANVACGAALTQQWLTAIGKPRVVRAVLAVSNPAVAVWYDPVTSEPCSYAELGDKLKTGMHHCGRLTFFNYQTDGFAISRQNAAVAAQLHEAWHGVQQSIGIRTVMPLNLLQLTLVSFRNEQGADCGAGAGMQWLVARGLRTSADLDEARNFIGSLGGDALHGTPPQRRAAFVVGEQYGLVACYAISRAQTRASDYALAQ